MTATSAVAKTIQPINLALAIAETICSIAPIVSYFYANQLTESRTALVPYKVNKEKNVERNFIEVLLVL